MPADRPPSSSGVRPPRQAAPQQADGSVARVALRWRPAGRAALPHHTLAPLLHLPAKPLRKSEVSGSLHGGEERSKGLLLLLQQCHWITLRLHEGHEQALDLRVIRLAVRAQLPPEGHTSGPLAANQLGAPFAEARVHFL